MKIGIVIGLSIILMLIFLVTILCKVIYFLDKTFNTAEITLENLGDNDSDRK